MQLRSCGHVVVQPQRQRWFIRTPMFGSNYLICVLALGLNHHQREMDMCQPDAIPTTPIHETTVFFSRIHTVDGKNPAPLRMPENVLIYRGKSNISGIISGAGFFPSTVLSLSFRKPFQLSTMNAVGKYFSVIDGS